VKFTTPIYHPNVSDEGGICLSILFKSCSWDNGWSPALSITSVLISIMVLMSEPATGATWQSSCAAAPADDAISTLAQDAITASAGLFLCDSYHARELMCAHA
jgi:ubiquitin-protein ligase